MEKILAVAIFVVMFALIIWDRFPRQWVTLGSGALVLVLVFGLCMHDGGAIWETLNLSCFIQKGFWVGSSESNTGINWSTIVFIAGMMVMVEGMGHAGIFQWLCLKIAKLVHYRTVPLPAEDDDAVYGDVGASGHVHRQHHCDPVPGRRDGGAGQDAVF